MSDQPSLWPESSPYNHIITKSSENILKPLGGKEAVVHHGPNLEQVYYDLNEALRFISDHDAELLVERARDEIYRYLR